MDKVEICNMALARIGAAQISSFNESSEQAQACLQFYEPCRRSVLRNYPWSFATRRVKLALLQEKSFDYKYAYRYPVEALYIRKLYDNEKGWPLRKVKHQIVGDANGKIILTDMDLAGAEITADLSDASVFDAEFCEALAWKIGGEIAMRVTGNINMANYCNQAYEHFINNAKADDSNESNPDRIHVNELTMSRLVGIDDYDYMRDFD